MPVSRSLATALLTVMALSAACGATTAGSSATSEGTTASRGGSLPDFTLPNVDGEEFRLSEHLGNEVILLNFWATWCEPCRIEMPHLDRLQRQYGDQGFRVVGISMDGPESVSSVRSQINRYDYELTVLLDQESEVAGLYNPRTAAPYNILISRQGEIVWEHEGYNPGDEVELEERIRAQVEAGTAVTES